MRITLFILLAFLLTACGNKKTNAIEPVKAEVELIAPADNELCTSGVVINANTSIVMFKWQPVADATSYQLIIKNLLTNTSKTYNYQKGDSTLYTTQYIELVRKTPFAWQVKAAVAGKAQEAVSNPYQFYNAGEGETSYAPYPAAIIAPVQDAELDGISKVKLVWKGSSVLPGTIANYTVYFGGSNTPPVYKADVADSFVDNVSVSPGKKYCWRVITKGTDGNTSDSGLYSFSVK